MVSKDHIEIRVIKNHEIVPAMLYRATLSYGGHDNGTEVDGWRCNCGKTFYADREGVQAMRDHKVDVMWEERDG
jgi:hypothetical protein